MALTELAEYDVNIAARVVAGLKSPNAVRIMNEFVRQHKFAFSYQGRSMDIQNRSNYCPRFACSMSVSPGVSLNRICSGYYFTFWIPIVIGN